MQLHGREGMKNWLFSNSISFYYGLPYSIWQAVLTMRKRGSAALLPQNSTEGDETQQGQSTSKGTWCVKIWARSAQARRRGAGKRPSATPKNLTFFCRHNHPRSHPLPVGRFSRNFRENTWICVLLNPFGAEF